MNMNFRQWLEAAARPAVLVATGAYNPIHKGHIQLFYHARRYLLNNSYDVIAAYMIPRNYDYIQRKSADKGEIPIPDHHRQEMINVALQGTFIKLLPLEQDRVHMSNQDIRQEIQKMHPDADIIFVAGDDKGGCPDEQDVCLQTHPRLGHVVIVGRRKSYNASSTEVRGQLRSHGSSPLVRPTVSNYIKQHRLWGVS